VQDPHRPPAQQLGLVLQVAAHCGEGRDIPVAHRHHEALPHEDVRLAELHRLGLVNVARRPEDDE
jgi:hypothetical protein